MLEDFPYISAEKKDSFARFTIEQRLPVILNNILKDNIYQASIQDEIKWLLEMLPALIVQPIKFDEREAGLWQDFFNTYAGKTIVEIPFFYAEIYFYRHLLTITQFEQNTIDPFLPIKQKELNEDTFNSLFEQCNSLTNAIVISLYGNKADLSQLHKTDGEAQLIVDHSSALKQSIADEDTIHLILDNAGVELFSDLLLAYWILQEGKHNGHYCKIFFLLFRIFVFL